MAGKINIDTEKCKGCGLCVAVCPKGSIAIGTESNAKGYFPPQTGEGECTGCCKCAVVCPEAVIEVRRGPSERIVSVGRPERKSRPALVEGKA